MIHASVIFRPGYKPSPAFPKNMGTWPAQLHWDDPDRQERLAELDKSIWEKDLFDHTAAQDLFTQLRKEREHSARILERIAFMASSGQYFLPANGYLLRSCNYDSEEGRKAISAVEGKMEISAVEGRKTMEAPLDILEAFLVNQDSIESKLMTSTESKLIRISAATAFSCLIPFKNVPEELKEKFEKLIGTHFLIYSFGNVSLVDSHPQNNRLS